MDNQPAIDHLTRLGFTKDPFSEQSDQDFYYENTELMQRLDMIQHLIGFSSQLIFITGEEGSGKTAMLRRLQYYAPDHWRICHIQASPMLSSPLMLRQLTSGFDLQPAAGSDDMMQIYSEALQAHVESLERSMLTPVVLIDDAHELPVDALTMLFGCLQQESGKEQLKIAMFCEPQILTMLDSPQLRSLSQNITHQLDIPNFTETQTADYLERRFEHAGLSSPLPLPDETVRRIHHESKGNVARINLLAQQALLDENIAAVPVVDQVFELESTDEDDPCLDDTFGDILDFDDGPEESEVIAASSVAPEPGEPNHSTAEQNKAPIIKKFQSWQIGAVAVVLALLAGVLWVTSQLSDTHEPSLAGEVPLDLSPAKEEVASTNQDSSIFDESTGNTATPDQTERADQVLSELEAILEDSEPGESIASDNEINTGQVSDQDGDEVTDQQTTDNDPLGEFVQSLEEDQSALTGTEAQITEPEEQSAEEVTDQLAAMISEAENSATDSITKPESAPVAETTQPDQSPAAQPEDPIAVLEEDPDVSGFITDIKSESWLRSLSDSQIVLQLMGTHDKQALNKFLVGSNIRDEIAWFTTEHNGSPWYVVVKGPYASRSAAAAAIPDLSEETRKRKPWPRSIANVKQAMDQAQ